MAEAANTTNPSAVDSLILKIVEHGHEGIERAVELLLDVLDALDGDPDLEPVVGWPEGCSHTAGRGAEYLRLVDCGEREDDSDLEPSLGWTQNGAHGLAFEGELDIEEDDEREFDAIDWL